MKKKTILQTVALEEALSLASKLIRSLESAGEPSLSAKAGNIRMMVDIELEKAKAENKC